LIGIDYFPLSKWWIYNGGQFCIGPQRFNHVDEVLQLTLLVACYSVSTITFLDLDFQNDFILKLFKRHNLTYATFPPYATLQGRFKVNQSLLFSNLAVFQKYCPFFFSVVYHFTQYFTQTLRDSL
jgi:hypothetical protein